MKDLREEEAAEHTFRRLNFFITFFEVLQLPFQS